MIKKRDDEKRVMEMVKKSPLPLTYSRISKNTNIYGPYLKKAISRLCREKKIIKFKTVNGYYYVRRSWRP